MIHIISTSANIKENYFLRKQQYLNGVASIIHHYQIVPYIIETHTATDYLSEHYLGHSNYSDNKGVNEFINIDKFIEHRKHIFKDDDIIIKTTLRYSIISSSFLDDIKSSNHEIYCKSSSDIYGPLDTGIHSFLFAMRYKCWREFLDSFDRTVYKQDPIERQLSDFARGKDTKYLTALGILANPTSMQRIYKV